MIIDAVIPALNEETTVGGVVTALRASANIDQVVVVDNGSSDRTAEVAEAAGAKVISCPVRGLGLAVKAGLAQARTELVLRTDADICNWSIRWVRLLAEASTGGLTRLIFDSPYDEFPVTRLVVEPLIRLAGFREIPRLPISGTYLIPMNAVDTNELADDWAFDISLLCAAMTSGLSLVEVEGGPLHDRPRDLNHYVPMASQIVKYFIDTYWDRKISHDAIGTRDYDPFRPR